MASGRACAATATASRSACRRRPSTRCSAPPSPPEPLRTEEDWVAVSGLAGRGLRRLEERVAGALGLGDQGPRGVVRELSARHRRGLERGLRELEEGLAAWTGGAPLDLLAEALRSASAELDAITGETTPEDVLDRIFAQFCLGK